MHNGNLDMQPLLCHYSTECLHVHPVVTVKLCISDRNICMMASYINTLFMTL